MNKIINGSKINPTSTINYETNPSESTSQDINPSLSDSNSSLPISNPSSQNTDSTTVSSDTKSEGPATPTGQVSPWLIFNNKIILDYKFNAIHIHNINKMCFPNNNRH